MDDLELEKYVIKRYLGREDYVVRIEKEKDIFIIKVYYKGRQSFKVENGIIQLTVSMFTVKAEKDFSRLLKEDVDKLSTLGFFFQIGKELSGSNIINKINVDLKQAYHYFLQVNPSTNKERYDDNEDYINKILSEYRKKIEKILGEKVERKTIGRINYFLFNNNEVEYDKLYEIGTAGKDYITSMKALNKRGLQQADINAKIKWEKPKNFSYSSFDTIDEIMEKRIKDYNENEGEEKKDEKVFQQELMNIMYDELVRKESNEELKVLNNLNSPFNKNTYPFLMEFNFYEDSMDKKKRQSNKGRVDNVFIKENKIMFIEIKYDAGVLDGKNGIHKHLLDVLNGIEKNQDFRREIHEVVENYNAGIDLIEENQYEKYKIPLVKGNNEFDDEVEFNIICGYSKPEKKVEVNQKIDSIYYKKASDIFKRDKEYEKKYGKKHIEKTIDELINELEKVGCKTHIYLVDNKFHYFEKYDRNLIQ